MSQTDLKILEAMEGYNSLRGVSSDGEEYVVAGAKVRCSCGDEPCILKLPVNQGKYTGDGRPFIVSSDSKETNLNGFGICDITKRKCKPSLGKWEVTDTGERIYNNDIFQYEYAVVKSSSTVCSANGVKGKITFETSGQINANNHKQSINEAEMVEIEENIADWWYERDKELFGHIKVERSGIYNLGLRIGASSSTYGGSVLIYSADWLGNLKLVRTCEFIKHTEIREELKEEIITIQLEGQPKKEGKKEYYYWNVWAYLVLEKNKNYYVEIDFPNIGSYGYKLVGNQEIGTLITEFVEPEKNTIAALWVISEEHERKMNEHYHKMRREGKLGINKMI